MSRILAIQVFLLSAGLLPAASFHVSPGGNDSNPGTEGRPFASLARAQKAVRDLFSTASSSPVTVFLRDGTYTLTEPLVFTPLDSGKSGAPVVYAAAPGARPVLSGGAQIRGWTQTAQGLWIADVPEVKSGKWRFNQLFVNGEPRPRARTPNVGFFRVAGFPEGTPNTVNFHTDCQSFEFKRGDIKETWSNLKDAEVIVYHFWTDSHLPIKSVDFASNIVTFAHKAGKVFTDDFTETGARYIVENVREELDIPGEWYLDRAAGRVYYMPRPGEDMNAVEVIAPQLPAFIHIRGDAGQNEFVEHLHFRGLSFRYSWFVLPQGNSNDQQGSASVPAAITLKGARDCRFENCAFQNLGTWAIEAGAGCSENAFVANDIGPVAAGGLRINGGTERDHPLERTSQNLIADNHLHDYGQVYPSAVGILLMHTEGNQVIHNHIHHGFYSGISVGWVWGYRRSISHQNEIAFNHIHDIGQGLLSDMGGIYTLGVSPGTVIRNNLIHDVDANQYGGWGIYHDEGSTHHLVESNVVYRTKFAPFNIHYAKEVTVRNNIFALGGIEQITRGVQEPHMSVFFENNIVYWKSGELFTKNWKDAPYSFHANPRKGGGVTLTNTFECNWNVYFDPELQREAVKLAGGSWEEWQGRGKDRNSIYADPMFVDPEKGDFRLQAGSPAFGLGFKPIDVKGVGPRVFVGPKSR